MTAPGRAGRLTSLVWLASASLAFVTLLGVATPGVLTAQTPAQAAQQLRDSGLTPDQVRQQIQQSGLSPDQVRARLQASGYPSNLLDSYLGGGVTGGAAAGAQPGSLMLQALEVLAPGPQVTQGLSVISSGAPPQPPTAVADTAAPGAVETLELFGLDAFRGRTTQFQPLLAGPVPANYRVGPGDVMILVLTGDIEIVHELAVTREGFIVIPQVGQIFVNDLTMEQLEILLRQRLGQSYSGIQTGTTFFDITVARLRTNQVYVIGEVMERGAYQLASVATILNGLYAAGGPTERANFRAIELQRPGVAGPVAVLDLYEYLLGGSTMNDVMLQQGDVVFVPPREVRASITGAVLRPALYDLAPGETLLDLIDYAGGVTQDAALHRARITRIVPPLERSIAGVDRTVLDVDLRLAAANPASAPVLEAGDSVRVFAVRNEVRNTVRVEGQVWYPGEYGYAPGMTAWDLIRQAQGFQPEAFLTRAQIVRLDQAQNTYSVIPFSADTTATGQPVQDVPLTEFDLVRVFSLEQFADEFPVTITGEVKDPRTEPFQEGMTLRDFILRAGGLQPTADLTVEISRLAEPDRRPLGDIAQLIRVSIDSSYVAVEGRQRFYLGHPDSLRAPVDAAAEVALQPYDQVFVRRIPDFELPRVVRVMGEVRFPGSYTLQRKDETLREVIMRSGALTPTAFPEGFRFYRGGSQVGVNLSGVLADAEHRDNIVLLPGDSLVVPEYDPVVRLRGAVVSEVDVLYRPGADLDYYIESAGGLSRNADRERISVRFANGEAEVKRVRRFFIDATPEPGPGSTITIGVQPEPEVVPRLELWGQIAQILASAIAIVAVAVR